MHPSSKAHRHWTYVERGFYGQEVSRLFGQTSREQLLFLRSDDLALEPQKTLDRLTDFLGIKRMEVLAPNRANERREFAYPGGLEPADIDVLRSEFQEDTNLFAAISGLDVQGWLTQQQDNHSPQLGLSSMPDRG